MHSIRKESIKDEKRVLETEKLADGVRGLSYTYLVKSGNDFMKLSAVEKEKDQFKVTTQKGEDKKTYTVDLKGLTEIVKKDKRLAFVAKYLPNKKML